MSFLLGLTGSIGMGKSTTAKLFEAQGCEIWDADAAVHRLYDTGGAAVEPISELFPDAIVDGSVSRAKLKEIIAADPTAISRIEKVVHPLVATDRELFKQQASADILVFDIPLLFETGGETRLDAVVCVSVDEKIQQQRVLNRGTMTLDQFQLIRDKQMPDKEKRARADYLVVTDTLEHAQRQVEAIVRDIRRQIEHA